MSRRTRPAVEGLEGRALPATFVVNVAGDDGPGSLRQAILDANRSPGPDAIAFAIPGPGVHAIRPASPLPAVADALTIDGTTQPGYAGRPLVDLAPGVGIGADGLVLAADDSAIRGLQVHGFADAQVLVTGRRDLLAGDVLGTTLPTPSGPPAGHAGAILRGADNTVGGATVAASNVIGGAAWGVWIDGPAASGNLIEGNRIGTTAGANAGAIAGTQRGIVVGNASGNVIGGTAPGAGNVITNGALMQVTIIGPGARSNRVLGNTIGGKLGGGGGVIVTGGASGNVIGGAVAGSGNTLSGDAWAEITLGRGAVGNTVGGNAIGDAVGPDPAASGVVVHDAANNVIGGPAAGRNVVIGFRSGAGVVIDGAGATGNLVRGNFLGVDASGRRAAANAVGVVITAPGNTIGGASAGQGNVISGNAGAGIILGPTAVGNRLVGNFLGTDADGASALGNGGPGLRLVGARSNVIGGTDPAARNVISANAGPGASLEDAVGNILQGNLVGTDLAGRLALGNGGAGILLTGHATTNLLGGSRPGATNLVSANRGGGIELIGAGVSGNAIQGDLIGVAAGGSAALGNGGDGLRIDGGPGNSVGGGFAGAGNLISGNGGDGLSLIGGASGTLVQGNEFGTDRSGESALGNRGLGILVQGGNNTIGGATALQRNVISGNGSTGLLVQGGPLNRVQGDFVGTDAAGASALGNGGFGLIVADAPGTIVGGPSSGEGDVVSGNGSGGVAFVGNVGLSQVQGDLVGTDATGRRALGNGGAGVLLLGGGVVVAGDVLSGNRGPGVRIAPGAGGDILQGNRIGTDAAGGLPLPNAVAGVLIEAGPVLVGGTAPGQGNVIADNEGPGVAVAATAGAGVSVLSNAIAGNAGPGLWLAPGAAGGLAYLAVSPPRLAGVNSVLRGGLIGRPLASYSVQFFLGYGDARVLVGATSTTTDADGRATFAAPSTAVAVPGQVLVASATDAAGSTSAFSALDAVPPTVAGLAWAGSQVVVSFSEEMDPAAASDPANYALFARTSPGFFISVPIRSVAYDPSTRRAILTPVGIPTYTLYFYATVGAAGLADLAGNALDGSGSGAPGGTFTGVAFPI